MAAKFPRYELDREPVGIAQNGTSQAISGHRNPLWTSSYNSAETQEEIDGGMVGHWGESA